ncbi:MAG: hypothetical protein K8W52_02025 [Deltaproteobacteria bacterium]|nr:hypothetical protein [Deltaproteobacteria bacterium]
MILTATAARWLLVLHTAVAVAAVGASTHLCLWLWRYLGGASGKRRALRRFAVLAMVLHGAAFVIGALAYPTYKTRVRIEYFDDADAVAAMVAARAEAQTAIQSRLAGHPVAGPSAAALARETAAAIDGADRIARWFDTKEHWAALGLALAIACAALLLAWDRDRDGDGPALVVRLCALGACGSLWFAAIVGVLTASWRAIGT